VTARTKLGATAWGYAWLRTIEPTTGRPDPRLPRARAIAQRQEDALTVDAPMLTATIADGRREHRVLVRVPPWADADAATAEALLASERERPATGDIPDHVVGRLTAAGLTVAVPLDEIDATCTCRTREAPCVHVLATLYGLVLSVDERPLTAWELRMPPAASGRRPDPDWLALSELEPGTFFTGRG
jgi:uncharacterized Zn finger protein